MPEVDAAEIPIPEMEEDIPEDDVAGIFGDFEEEDVPEAKRARANTQGEVLGLTEDEEKQTRKVNWADATDDELSVGQAEMSAEKTAIKTTQFPAPHLFEIGKCNVFGVKF